MRKKEDRLLVTFFTTAEAMAMEQACRREQIPGRLIPLPRQISAGCGFVWSAPPDCEDRLRAVLGKEKIAYESILRMIV